MFSSSVKEDMEIQFIVDLENDLTNRDKNEKVEVDMFSTDGSAMTYRTLFINVNGQRYSVMGTFNIYKE